MKKDTSAAAFMKYDQEIDEIHELRIRHVVRQNLNHEVHHTVNEVASLECRSSKIDGARNEGFLGLFRSQYIALGKNDAKMIQMGIDPAFDTAEEIAGDSSIVPQTTTQVKIRTSSTVVTGIDANTKTISSANHEEEEDPSFIFTRTMENVPKLGAKNSTEESSYNDFDINLNLPPHIDPREVENQKILNVLLPAGLSSSTTPNLETEEQLQLVEQSKSESDPDIRPDVRWVKRFKMTCDTSKGTKMTEMAEYSNSSPKPPTMHKGTKKKRPDEYEKKLLLESENKGKNNEVTMMPDAWIRRWKKEKSSSIARNSSEEPATSSNTTTLKNRCPSIGAMALLGKGVVGFKPSQLQKKGPLKSWND